MPEGPEVKKIAEGLARAISGKILSRVTLLSGRYTKKQPSEWDTSQNNLPLRIIGAGAHGKFCYWLCSEEVFIYSTLGMTGSWNNFAKDHARIKFDFADGTSVYFNDQRNFGTIKVVTGRQNLINKLQSLGPDMLAEDVSDQKFISRMRTKEKWGVTKALMDQTVVAGIGNYIKSDSLWLAKINPHRTVNDISDGELAILNRSIKKVIRESYSSGTTVSSYEGFSGDQNTDEQRFLVYSQKIDPDGLSVKKEETADKRSTFWVPEVQK